MKQRGKRYLIGVISSVAEEGALLIGELKKSRNSKNLRVPVSPRLRVYYGTIDGYDIVYMISGMGKTNAAHAATVLIEKYSPDLVVLFGVGGAYPSTGLKVGDIAVAEEEIYGDEGVLDREGFHGAEFIGIPLLKRGRKRYFNKFPLDRTLASRAAEVSELISRHSSPVTAARSGVFVTVSTCTGTRKRALELRKKFDAICENMEGASVAHICAIYERPMIELRGISNVVEDRDPSKWNIKLAAENCQRSLMQLLKKISEGEGNKNQA